MKFRSELVQGENVTETDEEQIKKVSVAQENLALRAEVSTLQKKLNQRRIGIFFLAKKGYPIPELRFDSAGWDLDKDDNYRLYWGANTWVTEEVYLRQLHNNERTNSIKSNQFYKVKNLADRIQALSMNWKRYKSDAAEGRFDGAAFSQSCVERDITAITTISDDIMGRKPRG